MRKKIIALLIMIPGLLFSEDGIRVFLSSFEQVVLANSEHVDDYWLYFENTEENSRQIDLLVNRNYTEFDIQYIISLEKAHGYYQILGHFTQVYVENRRIITDINKKTFFIKMSPEIKISQIELDFDRKPLAYLIIFLLTFLVFILFLLKKCLK